MRKFTFFSIFIFAISFFSSITANAVTFVPPETVYSEAVFMVSLDDTDAENYGVPVFKQNENVSLSPASLTKVMTALLVLEEFGGDENTLKSTYVSAPSTAFDELYGLNASTADFRIGELASYSDLLYGLMLQSACEAANIIAYNLGANNSMADFIKQMNDKAAELGATNTYFTNAHGLYSETQRTTAKDLAIITQYAMNKYPIFMEIASTSTYQLEATNKHSSTRTIVSTNYMMSASNGGDLYYYPYVKGIKTGTLNEAGRCLITTAEKNGYKYLIVTMNSPLKDENGNNKFYNFLDHKVLYEWAFSKLSYQTIVTAGEEADEIYVEYGKGASHVLLKTNDEFSCLWSSDASANEIQRVVLKESESIIAPIAKDTKLGTLQIMQRGVVIAEIDLVAASSVERDNTRYKIQVAQNFFSSKMFKYAIYISIGLVILYSAMYFAVLANSGKRKRRNNSSAKKRNK